MDPINLCKDNNDERHAIARDLSVKFTTLVIKELLEKKKKEIFLLRKTKNTQSKLGSSSDQPKSAIKMFPFPESTMATLNTSNLAETSKNAHSPSDVIPSEVFVPPSSNVEPPPFVEHPLSAGFEYRLIRAATYFKIRDPNKEVK